MANESGGTAQDRYVVISADTHGGGDLLDYRAYLEPQWLEEFDAWVAQYSSPYDDLVHATAERNWNSERRLADLDADGIVAEIVFPNTVPPFFNTISGFATLPWTREDFERRRAGAKAHNRWLVDFGRQVEGRRRGLVTIFPHDVDLAIEEARWAKETGQICGVHIPAIPPNHAVEPWFHPRYEPFWAACADLDLPIHQHGGTGGPDVGMDAPAAPAIMVVEMKSWVARTLTHLILAGVFERHPTLKGVWTEQGASFVLPQLRMLDNMVAGMKSTSANRTVTLFGSEVIDSLSLKPSEYFARNCFLGASFLHRKEVADRYAVGVDKIMWGCDYPHEEGSTPYSREALRATFFDVPVDECRKMLGETAAAVYGFDLDVLRPLAERLGPTVEEIQVPLTEKPADSNCGAFGSWTTTADAMEMLVNVSR
jgi:predicted TIM-barrel fold metal-dependent hydrolase